MMAYLGSEELIFKLLFFPFLYLIKKSNKSSSLRGSYHTLGFAKGIALPVAFKHPYRAEKNNF